MVSMTLAIDERLRDQMRQYPEINWSEIARQAIKQRVKRQKLLAELDEMVQDSELTEQEAISLGRKLRRTVGRRIRDSS